LVYDNTDLDAHYYPHLVTKFYLRIDIATIDHDQFVVYLDHEDLVVTGVLLRKPPKSHPLLSMLHYCP